MDTYSSYNFLSLGSFPLKDKAQQITKTLPFPGIAHKFFASWSFLKEATDGCITHTCHSSRNLPRFYFPPVLFPQNCSPICQGRRLFYYKTLSMIQKWTKEIMYWVSQQWNISAIFQNLKVVGKGDQIPWVCSSDWLAAAGNPVAKSRTWDWATEQQQQ